MKDKGRTKEQLMNEMVKMRQQVADLEKYQSKQKSSSCVIRTNTLPVLLTG